MLKNRIKANNQLTYLKGLFMNKKMILILIIVSGFFCACSSSDSKTKLVGTSDSGGGNGIENKAYEAYVINPTNLSAFKNILEPKLQKLAKLLPNKQAEPLLYRWLTYKTWFLAPVELTTISKEIIGVSFSKTGTEQLAIQTKKSVWLDSRKFLQMTEQDQAVLLAHEMVMSLYYLKYKSWEQSCLEKLNYGEYCKNKKDIDIMNELFPGYEPKPYNHDDYENIRAVTAIFIEDRQFQTFKEVDDLLISHDFDRRFTSSMGLEEDNSTHEAKMSMTAQVDMSVVQEAFQNANLLNAEISTCLAINTKIEKKCKAQLVVNGKTGVVLITEGGNIIHQFNLLNFEGKLNFTVYEREDIKRRDYIITLYPEYFPTPAKLGTHFRSGYIELTQDISQENLPVKLVGIVSNPGVVLSILPKDDPQGFGCKYDRPNPVDYQSDAVLMFNRSINISNYKSMRISALLMPPFTFCR